MKASKDVTMTEQEEQDFRIKLRKRWGLNKDQEDWYVAKVKAVRESIKRAEAETERRRFVCSNGRCRSSRSMHRERAPAAGQGVASFTRPRTSRNGSLPTGSRNSAGLARIPSSRIAAAVATSLPMVFGTTGFEPSPFSNCWMRRTNETET